MTTKGEQISGQRNLTSRMAKPGAIAPGRWFTLQPLSIHVIPNRPITAILETFVRRNEYSGGPDWAAAMFSDKYAASSFIPPFILWEDFEDYATHDSVGYKITSNYPAGSTLWVESANGNRPFKYITPVNLVPGDSIVVADIITCRFFIGGDDRLLMSKQMIQFDKTPEWYVISDKNHGGVEGTPQCMANSSDANHIFVGNDKRKVLQGFQY